MHIDLENLREEFKISKKELIDTCLSVVLNSISKAGELTIAEEVAIKTLKENKILVD